MFKSLVAFVAVVFSAASCCAQELRTIRCIVEDWDGNPLDRIPVQVWRDGIEVRGGTTDSHGECSVQFNSGSPIETRIGYMAKDKQQNDYFLVTQSFLSGRT